MFCTEWLLRLACSSCIVYERLPDYQVFYVLPVESILGKLPVVPVGETGTIPYCMRQAEDLVGAAFDTREGAGDGSRCILKRYSKYIKIYQNTSKKLYI